jgi:hypothetical protein
MSSYEFIFNGDTVDCSLEREGDNLKVKIGEREFEFVAAGNNLFSTNINGLRSEIAVVKHKGVYYVDIDSVLLEVQEVTDATFSGLTSSSRW